MACAVLLADNAPVEQPETTEDSEDALFTSRRERRLWTWAGIAVATIYLTLGLAGTLAGALDESGLNAATFVLGSVLVLIAAVTFGLRGRSGATETFVALGLTAVYVLLFTRLTSPVERSHLIEYGVVALLIHGALAERNRNGRCVRMPALVAIVATSVIGLVDEVIQWFLPNRVFDPVDVVFNTGAAALAVVSAEILGWARRRSASG